MAASFAFALADDRIPNEDAIAMAPTTGWLLLTCAVFVALMFLLQSERWRRWWLTNEDPRPVALFRIVFAFLCICNINDLWEYFTFLFSDEGIFLSDSARQLVAANQFRGFGDGIGDDPYGFFDFPAVLEFLKGHKYSLLYFWDTPAAMWTQLIAFYTVTTLFMIGWRTRIMGVLSFFLMNSFFLRNHLFWEGTELVYRVFFFYLLLAKSGHAYSVDNWLRTRKLRKQGLLSERGGPGNGAGVAPSAEHPQGLQAVYRLIPAWPRNLMMLNLGVLYCYTGVVKNGHVWAKGDALYYALNMDHFYRFYPQEIASIPWVGLGLFRLATWITHWWEALFPMMVLGVITRWSIREKLEPLHGWRLWAVRACWLGFGVMCGALVVYTMPVHYAQGPGQWSIQTVQLVTAFGWLALISAIGAGWWALGNRPPALRLRGTRYVLDREWFCKWVLGRRVWLTLGLIFHGNLQVLMNIGMFPPIMMSTYLFFLQGDEPGRILRFFGRGLARAFPWLPLPADVRRGEPPIPAEDRTLPQHRRDGRRLPPKILFGTLAALIFGIVLHASPLVPWIKVSMFGYEEADAHGIHIAWTMISVMVFLTLYTYIQGHRGTRNFVPKLVGLAVAILLYLWLMAKTGETTQEKDALLYWKIGVNLLLLLIVCLSQIPAAQRRLARIGLTFAPPDRPKREPDLPAIDARGNTVAPWSYGPAGRLFIGTLVVYHIVAIAIWELPEKDCLSTFRIKAREPFNLWVLTTQTDQQWGMFAPNPPRHNVFMRTVITDENGEQWDLRTDTYAQERKPIPWVWNDRMRKMNRRIIGGESGKGDWYQKWYGRFLCRQWALAHRGVMPTKVELYKVSYRMPAPEVVVRQGWYSPERLMYETGREERQHTTKCAGDVHGQLPNFIRERYDLPLLEDGVYKPWVQNKQKAWLKRYDPPKSDTKSDAKTDTKSDAKDAKATRATPAASAARKKAEEAGEREKEATPPPEAPKMD